MKHIENQTRGIFESIKGYVIAWLNSLDTAGIVFCVAIVLFFVGAMVWIQRKKASKALISTPKEDFTK